MKSIGLTHRNLYALTQHKFDTIRFYYINVQPIHMYI